MEAQENSPSKNLFQNMKLSDRSDNQKKEIQLFSSKSLQTCRICGKFGRKDVLKLSHFMAHKYVPASRHGFVLNGGEPKYDKFDDFHEYQLHFGLELTAQIPSSPLEECSQHDQLECQGFQRNITSKKAENQNQQSIKKTNAKVPENRKKSATTTKQEPTPDGLNSKSKKIQKSAKKLEVKVNRKSLRGQAAGTNKAVSAIKSRNMRKLNKYVKQKVKDNQKKKMKADARSRSIKSMKTLKVSSTPGQNQCSRELRNLQLWNFDKEISKQVPQETNIEVFALTRLQTNQDAPQLSNIGQRDNTGKQSWHKWQCLIQKQRLKDKIQRQREIADHFRFKLILAEELNRVEILDLNEEHKQLMLREREKHCHLYNQSANFESTKHKLEEQMKCTKMQRDEIHILLTRLAKYAPREVTEYPKNMIVNGNLDPYVWKLTRRAATDEQLIKDLESQLEAKNKQVQEISKENLDFKNQLLYASNHIKMMSDASKVVVQNILLFRQQGIQFNNQIQLQPVVQRPPENVFIPDENDPNEEFEYCHEEVESESESSIANSSNQSSSLIKSVSFCSTESIVGKKWINPENPKSAREQQANRKAKKLARKRKDIERIRQLYQKSSNSSHPQLLPHRSSTTNQVNSHVNSNSNEQIIQSNQQDQVISRNKGL